jgi:2-dehydro-3-deoxygalactonokinase
LLDGTGGDVCRARLSGILIGAELAAARPYWLGQEVVVAGAPASAESTPALATQGVTARTSDADPLTRLGLMRARAAMRETVS